jgi:hypothetical protein
VFWGPKTETKSKILSGLREEYEKFQKRKCSFFSNKIEGKGKIKAHLKFVGAKVAKVKKLSGKQKKSRS